MSLDNRKETDSSRNTLSSTGLIFRTYEVDTEIAVSE